MPFYDLLNKYVISPPGASPAGFFMAKRREDSMYSRESSSKRGYDSRWQKARAGYLRSHPLCVMCRLMGKLEPATVVDHIIPHKGDMELFWRRTNWQALCKTCHDSHKKRLEMSGRVAGCDANGLPLDPNHAWHQVDAAPDST
jgi:hypothetical protein